MRVGTTWFHAGTATVVVHCAIPAAARAVRTLYPAYQVAAPVGATSATINIRSGADGAAILEHAGATTRTPHWLEALSLAEMALGQSLLGGFTQCLHLHAGGVLGAAGAVLLPAASGSGKSTLVAHCCRQGWPVFGDDVVLLEPKDLRLHPFKRLLKLEQDVWPLLELHEAAREVAGPWPHVALVDPSALPGGWATPSPLAAVVIPRFQAGAPLRLQRTAGGAAVVQMLSQSFNIAARGGAGIEVLARVVDATPVYQLAYGSLDEAAHALATLLDHTSKTRPRNGRSAGSGP